MSAAAMPDPRIDEDLSSSEPLLRAARPILDRANDQLADSGTALLLTDGDSRLITCVFGDAQIERSLGRLGAIRGSVMGEDAVGTTALGTPVETRRPLAVNGEEHFVDAYKQLSCFGQPILHPTTRRLAGILCMTSVSDRAHPLFVPVVRQVVADIEARLLDHARHSDQAVLDAFHRTSARHGAATVAVADGIQLTDTMAANLLDPADIGMLRALIHAGRAFPESLTLASGVTVALTGERIVGANRAAVFALRPESTAPQPVPRGASITATGVDLFPAPSPARGARSVAVVGEPGSGRTTHAEELAGDRGIVRLDIAEHLAAGRPVDLVGTLRRARDRDAMLIVDGVELLTDRDLGTLRHIVTDDVVPQPVTVIAATSAAERPEVAAVLAVCDEQVTLPALRHRTQRIAALSRHFLHRHAPDARLTAAATEALVAHDWPANLTELDRAMASAAAQAAHRDSRLIELDDLPERYRHHGRTVGLSVADRVERQSIVDALADCRGNKVHAARLLGISRSTLYSRMRSYGIDGR
ncbi:transcriptional regulator MimR [Gordonia sinesedis]